MRQRQAGTVIGRANRRFLLGAALLGVLWSAPAIADDGEAGLYLLVGIEYLANGRPFGFTDYGLRVPQSFCERQSEVLVSRWLAEGARIWRDGAYWQESRKVGVKLFCVPEQKFNDDAYRSRLVTRRLRK